MLLRKLRKPRAIDEVLAQAGRGQPPLAYRGLPAEVLGIWCLGREMARSKRTNSPLAVGLLTPLTAADQVHFAKALDVSVSALKKTVRAADIVAWQDENSILAILPDTSSDNANTAMARLRSEMWHRSLAAGGLLWTSVVVANAARFEDPSDVIAEARRLVAGSS